jgi:hypothetical protein
MTKILKRKNFLNICPLGKLMNLNLQLKIHDLPRNISMYIVEDVCFENKLKPTSIEEKENLFQNLFCFNQVVLK